MKIDDKLEREVLDFIKKCYKQYSNRSGWESNLEKWDNLYNGITEEKFYNGTANLFPPETRRACKTLINFIDETLFSTEPFFKIVGVDQEDEKKAQILQRIMFVQLQKMNFRREMRKAIKNLVKYGMCILKDGWLKKTKKVVESFTEREKLFNKILGNIEGEVTIEKIEKVVYDYPFIENKDLRNIYFDPYTPWEEQICIIEKKNVTFSYLKSLEYDEETGSGVYINLDKLYEDIKNKDTDRPGQEDIKLNSNVSTLSGLTDNIAYNDKNIEILECWLNYDLDGDGIDEEVVCVVANGEHIIRLEPNPHNIQEKPYTCVVWEEIDGTCLGQGVVQLAERSQIALNDFMNQVMDNITQILNNMWIVDEMAEIPEWQLKSRPNGIIKSRTGVDGVKPLDKPLTAQAGLQAIALVKEDIRQITGATVSLQGLPARYDTTATEYQIQQQSSARDVFAKIRDIEDYVVKPFLRRLYSYNLQYLSRKQFIDILGKDASESLIGTDVNTALTISRDLDFIPLGVTSIENKTIKAQQLINFLNIAGRLPAGMVRIDKIVDKIWKILGDNDEVIVKQPEPILVAPEDENILISQGHNVVAKLFDDHNKHILVHSLLMLPPELDMIKQIHIEQHKQFLNSFNTINNSGGLVPPQEQPELAPRPITENTVGVIQNRE